MRAALGGGAHLRVSPLGDLGRGEARVVFPADELNPIRHPVELEVPAFFVTLQSLLDRQITLLDSQVGPRVLDLYFVQMHDDAVEKFNFSAEALVPIFIRHHNDD